jgi:hypothetical protein
MRIQIETHADLRAAPRRLYRGERRIDITEIVDQWYGPGYRYVKVKAHDNSEYILRFDEICDHWELIMFCAASALGAFVDARWRIGRVRSEGAGHRHGNYLAR